MRPLLSITFPQEFRISKNIGHPTSGSGAKRRLNGTSKVNIHTHGHTERQTDISTYRKHRPRGPMLWKSHSLFVTCDIWWGVNILSKFQYPSSYRLGNKVFWRFGGKGWLNYPNCHFVLIGSFWSFYLCFWFLSSSSVFILVLGSVLLVAQLTSPPHPLKVAGKSISVGPKLNFFLLLLLQDNCSVGQLGAV